jgi:hypothetical protein
MTVTSGHQPASKVEEVGSGPAPFAPIDDDIDFGP